MRSKPPAMRFTTPAKLAMLLVMSAGVTALAQKKPAEPAPPVTYSIPAAAISGAATEITFFGAPAGKPVGFWSSFPATATLVPGDSLRYRVDVPPTTPVGIGAVRLATTGGVSSLQLFMVDDLPAGLRNGRNTTRQSAQQIPPLTAIDGACEPLTSDYYRFAARKGQRIAFEVVSQRLGSRLDPMVRLLSENGAELAYCDDTPGLGADCRFAHTFQADGNYLVELRDANYEGGSDYRYHLRVGDFPAVTAAFPIAGKRGAQASFHFEGVGGERIGPVSLTLPGDAPRAWVSARAPGGRSSTMVWVLCDERPDRIAAGNLSPGTAMAIEPPSSVSGRFEHAGDRHWFAIAGGKGRRISIRSQARSVGSPCDLYLQLLKSDGTRVAESKPTGPEEGSLDAAIPEQARYRLAVEDLNHLGGVGAVYRLEFQPRTADFAISTEVEKIDATAGRSFKLKVKVGRHDYAGPIALALVGQARGLEVKSSEISAGKTDAEIEIAVATDAPVGGPKSFGIIGKATFAGAQISHPLSTEPALRKLFPRLAYTPIELDGLIGLSIRPSDKPGATTTRSSAKPPKPR